MGKEKNEDLRTIRTRKHLSKSLLDLLCSNSIDEITIIQICEKAKVHRTTFYKHFTDKFDLFEYVINEIRDEMYEKAINTQNCDTSKSLYMNLANTTLDYIDEHCKTLTNILKNNKDEMLSRILLTSIDKSVNFLLEKNKDKFNSQVPILVASKFYTGGFISLATWWLLNPELYTKTHILKYIDMLIDERLCTKANDNI